jgi:RHS repeat-associated protein
MNMPGRKYSQVNSSYRYGFNGKEKDNEDYGEGNAYDFGARIYDPRLGRFLSVDPLYKDYSMYTPYQYANNSPIGQIDVDGEVGKPSIYKRLRDVYETLLKKLDKKSVEYAILIRGASNALVSANTLTISDHLPGAWNTDNVNDYRSDYHKSLYLLGRIGGDALAIIQGEAEITGGLGAASGAGQVALASGGTAIVGSSAVAIGGLVVAAHGGGVTVVAAADIGASIKQLAALEDAWGDAPKKKEESSGGGESQPKKGDRAKSTDDASKQYEGITKKKQELVKEKPSIKDDGGEWEGVKRRPKQNAIQSTEKSKQRDKQALRRKS